MKPKKQHKVYDLRWCLKMSWHKGEKIKTDCRQKKYCKEAHYGFPLSYYIIFLAERPGLYNWEEMEFQGYYYADHK